MEPANFAELRSKIDSWDISAEELLLQKMKIFTINYNEEFQQFCKNMDKFSNHIDSVEVEHLKAINQIKKISREKFIENTLDKGDESESESVSNENNIIEAPREIQITNVEKMKEAINISLGCLNEINKNNKNKEEIEDDTVSLASSKMTMDKEVKGVKLPFIIGTEEFKADKAIGLNVKPDPNEDEENNLENQEEEDVDVQDFVKDIKVDKKQREKWERIERRKRRKREKEEKRLAESKTFANNIPKNEEPEVKVPIENEIENKEQNKDQNNIVVNAPDPSKSGGAIPPPPPPPPPPPKVPTIISPSKKTNSNAMNAQEIKPTLADNQEKQASESNNQQNIQPQPIPQEPLDFKTMLRNRMQQQANPNNRINTNTNNNSEVNENKNNVNPNSVSDLLHTDADNKNPLAPVIRDKNIIINRENVKLNAFLGTADVFGGENDDDDEDDLSTSIFKKKKTQPIVSAPQPESNIAQNQNPQINQNIGQPMMIMGMPRPTPTQEQNIQSTSSQPQVQNPMIMGQPQMMNAPQIQMPMVQQQMEQPQIMNPQFGMFNNQQETNSITIKKNRGLEEAKDKLESMFESDDEDEMDSGNIVDKTEDITKKVNVFMSENQQPQKEEINKPKTNLFDETQKQNDTKPKLSFFDEDNEKETPKIGINLNNVENNNNSNTKVNEEKPKPKLNLFDDDASKDTIKIENKESTNQQKPKAKISFFDDDDNEPVKENQKDKDEKKETEENKTQNPPQPKQENETKPLSFMEALRSKLPKKETEQIKPQQEIPKKEEPQIQSQEQAKEKPKISLFDNKQTEQTQAKNENKQKISLFDNNTSEQPKSQPQQKIESKPKISLFDNPSEQNKPHTQLNIKQDTQKEEAQKKNEDNKPKPVPRKSNPKFAAMQSMLANRMGKGGGMMMMGGPPPKKEEVKIEHDEKASDRGTGENNYEAVVKRSSVVKKRSLKEVEPSVLELLYQLKQLLKMWKSSRNQKLKKRKKKLNQKLIYSLMKKRKKKLNQKSIYSLMKKKKKKLN